MVDSKPNTTESTESNTATNTDEVIAQRAATGDQRDVVETPQPVRSEVQQTPEELGLGNAVDAAAGRSTADQDTNAYRPETTATGEQY